MTKENKQTGAIKHVENSKLSPRKLGGEVQYTNSILDTDEKEEPVQETQTVDGTADKRTYKVVTTSVKIRGYHQQQPSKTWKSSQTYKREHA